MTNRLAKPVPVSGPSGLSDLAVSPMGNPAALLTGAVRVAILCRTSTEDQQDPRQSIMRQHHNSRAALPTEWVVVATFYDVESGRKTLAARGSRGKAYHAQFNIPIPRDGGIQDLLAEAASEERRFDVVVCEGISRVARRQFEGLSIERTLETSGVPLFSSEERISLDTPRSQQVMQRGMNRVWAEAEVIKTLEMSWGGMCSHVRDGYNIGVPPYGYRGEKMPHPNAAKAEKGKKKTRLVPDGIRAEAVTQIAHWRFYDGLSYAEIADKMNADLDTYPPPIPASGKQYARGAWSKTSVQGILKNPKYTGFQVFNRRASSSASGKHNDPVKWVWSPAPTHDPLIPKEMWDEINARSKVNEASRANGTNPHPQTKNFYSLRGMVFCGCGRRMFGSTRQKATYYMCWPGKNNRGKPSNYAGHPVTTYLRENSVLDAVTDFFNTHIFGPDRRALLAGKLSTFDTAAANERDAERHRLQTKIADLTRRQHAIMQQVQAVDPSNGPDAFAHALRQDYNDLDAEKTATRAALEQLDATEETVPRLPSEDETALLDALPYLTLNHASAPPELLRELFEAVDLTAELDDPDGDTLTITAALTDDYMEAIHQAAEAAADIPTQRTSERAKTAGQGMGVDVVGAPDGVRTRTESILSRLPLPVGLRGHRTL